MKRASPINKQNQYTPTHLADFYSDTALAYLGEKIRRKKKAKNLPAHFQP